MCSRCDHTVTDLPVAAFNNLINRGLPRDAPSVKSSEELEEVKLRNPIAEVVPAWASLKETLVLPDKDGRVLASLRDESSDKILAEKNILCDRLHIHFVQTSTSQ